jgi:hypothetical protein
MLAKQPDRYESRPGLTQSLSHVWISAIFGEIWERLLDEMRAMLTTMLSSERRLLTS